MSSVRGTIQSLTNFVHITSLNFDVRKAAPKKAAPDLYISKFKLVDMLNERKLKWEKVIQGGCWIQASLTHSRIFNAFDHVRDI